MRCGFFAAILLAIALPAYAADEALVLRMRAEQLAAEDKCEEALPRARQARDLDPSDARAAVVEGRCELREGRYRAALGALRSAQELDPGFPGIATDMAQCHYHVDELDAAEGQLQRALAADPNDGRANLYQGLLHLRRAENAEAAVALERASGDTSVSPVASYYAGLAWEASRDRERASAALERARASAPGTEWAEQAERALDRVDEPYKKHIWASVTGGLQYDSNVTLRDDSSSVTDANNLTTFGPTTFRFREEDDLVGVFYGEIGAELLRNPDWSLGGVVGYQGDAHVDLHEFDTQYPWASLWLDRRLDEKSYVRLQPFLGYRWLETDPFVFHGGTTLSVGREFAKGLIAQVYGRYNYNEYLFRTPDDVVLSLIPGGGTPSLAGQDLNNIVRRRRNRDGSEIETGLEAVYEFESTGTDLRGGGAYERYESEGEDWQYQGLRAWLGFTQELPFEFTIRADGSFAHRPFAHRSSYLAPLLLFSNSVPAGSTNPPYSGPKRRDNVWDAAVELERPVHENVKLSVRYQYVDNDSNTEVFDSQRHIVGGYITISWNN